MGADDLEDTAPAAPPEPGTWSKGSLIGRFVITGTLGAGGMGSVYAAYDPVLDRNVALKTMKRVDDSAGSSALLVREAQAMARLQHPNVCTVYEIGTVGNDLFIAMELVEGGTLGAWMKQPHSWREIVWMFIAAGRGLEAAHAAGLVHRDFKPENVLLGLDGRPRVSDFGLVSLRASRRIAGDSSSTIAAAGTPAYMAPEQARGELADARSDQFSFCVALWEALTGKRPQITPKEPALPSIPPELPTWLGKAMLRGLAPSPSERWPSLGELLEVLGRDPARARRRWLAGATVAVALLASVLGGVRWQRSRREASCRGAIGRLAGVWDEAVRGRLAAAFVATGAVDARDTWTHVERVLDGYSARWAATHEEACRATQVEGRQSDTLLDLRMTCLDRRRATLAALTQLWLTSLTPERAGQAVTAATSLDTIEECSDARALSSPLPTPRDAAARDMIAAARARLDGLRALMATANWTEARKQAEALQPAVEATHFAPLEAEAKLLIGTALDRLDEPTATAILADAARQAALAHDDVRAARALIKLMTAFSSSSAQFERSLGVLPAATAAVARAGDPPELRGLLHKAHASVLIANGQAGQAKTEAEAAIPLLESALGPDAPDTVDAQMMLAGAAYTAGDYDTARRVCEAVLDKRSRINGASAPEVAHVLKNLGMVEDSSGHLDRARDYYERALSILRTRLGDHNGHVADLYNGLGNVEYHAGHYDAAVARYQAAIDAFSKEGDPASPFLVLTYGNMGAARREQGRLPDALALGKKAVELARKAFGDKHPQLATLESEYAATLRAARDFAGARAVAEEALAIYVASSSAAELIGSERFELAQDLWGAGDRSRALATAELARADLQRAGDAGRDDLKHLEAWLKTRAK